MSSSDINDNNNISLKGRPFKTVKLRIPKSAMDKFLGSFPPGFVVRVYAPPAEDPTHPLNYVPSNVHAVTIQCNERNPNPRERLHMHDIDDYLSRLTEVDRRIRIVSDKVTKKEQPNLLEGKEQNTMRVTHLIDSPALDGELDFLRSKAQNITEVEIRQSSLQAANAMYSRAKKDFIRSTFRTSEAEEIPDKKFTHADGSTEKLYKVRQAQI